MRPHGLIIPILFCAIIFNSGCEKIQENNDYALVTTSIVATRNDASVQVTLNIFNPEWAFKNKPEGSPVYVNPDYYEVFLSKNTPGNFKLIKTVNNPNNSFIISGLTNNTQYYIYLKGFSDKVKDAKTTKVVMFIPSTYKPDYNFIMKDYYGHDLYSFDRNSSNSKFVYATKYYEFETNYAAPAIFIGEPNNEPQLIDLSGWFPDFNSDGTRLAYSSDKGEIFDGQIRPEHIAIYDNTTQEITKVTYGYSVNKFPAWSPDNSLLAYSSSGKSDKDLRITILNPETLEAKILETESILSEDILSYSQTHPAWSSDGEYIYYTQGYTTNDNVNPGYYDIYRIKSSGGTPERVFNFEGTKCSPIISPDNSKLAFLSDLNGKLSIWIYYMNEERYYQAFDTEEYSFSKDWPGLVWNDNNTILFSAYSKEKGEDYSLFSITIE